MRKLLILLSLFFVFGFANAQNDSKQPLFKVSSFSSSIGFAGAMTSNTDADYYGLQKIVENPDLFVDITGFSNRNNYYYGNSLMSSGYYSSGSGNGSLVFNLGLTPYSKKLGKCRENRELRITVGGNIGIRNTFNYYKNNFIPLDTFQSVNGSGLIYADSNIYSNYTYTLNFTDINFGLSYIFKTDVKRRVHFYAGLGVNYGIALRSTVNVSKYTFKSIYYYNEYNPPTMDDNGYFYWDNNSGTYSDSYTSSNLKSPMQFIKATLPIGISLRLSNKEGSFFNHVNLYTELNPGVEIQVIPNDKTYANPFIGVAFIGFSYHW